MPDRPRANAGGGVSARRPAEIAGYRTVGTMPALATVPAGGAIVFANLVSLFPGRVAARSRTTLLLRAE